MPSETNPGAFKTPLRYGLLAAVLGAALVITLYKLDRHPFLVPIILDFRIMLFGIFVFFSLRDYRDMQQQGILYFWQGMIQSFLLITTYAIVVCMVIVVIGWTDPDFVKLYIERFTDQARQFPPEVIEQIGKAQFEKSLADLKDTTIYSMAATYFVQCYAIGFFVSIILSVILRRQPKTNP